MSQVIDGTGVNPADETALRAFIAPWAEACVQRDWGALLAMCTDDVIFLPPNEPAVQGPDVRAWLETFPTIRGMTFDFDHIESSAALACGRGPVKMDLEVSGQPVAFDGKFTDHFRRQPDGTWRFSLVMWSSNQLAT